MKARRNRLIVGCDPMSQALAILEQDRAIEDTRFIRALVDSRTVGGLRAGDPTALDKARRWYEAGRDQQEDPPFEELPDDHPYQIDEWFGSDSWYNMLPLARLITAETAPIEITREFGQEDYLMGLDYEPATWFRHSDKGAVVARLRQLGFEVDDSRDAQAVISMYDFSGA